MKPVLALLLITLLLVSCHKEPPSAHDKAPPAATIGASSKELTPAHPSGLAWFQDQAQSETALAIAKAEGKLLFVDLWASWCHTCLSMREYVLTAANLRDVQKRLVFLAVDTERTDNAALLKRLPIAAWPTFYLVDANFTVYGRFIGAASPAQLSSFVRDGLDAYDAAKISTLPAADPLALMIAGDRLAVAGRLAEARDHYQHALSAAPASWPRRPDALVALAATLRKLQQLDACVDLGLRELPHSGSAASSTDFASGVLGCADGLDADDARRARLQKAAEQRLTGFCSTPGSEMTADDRGDACGLLRELRDKLGDAPGARAALEQRLAVLTEAAQGVPDHVALAYDFARSESLVALGRGDEAIALLKARERALTNDYNPAHYLARVYRDLGRFDEGLAAIERALALALQKAQAPRRAGMLGVKVDLLLGLGKRAEAKQTLEQQLAAYRALPEGQAQASRERAVAERLATWK